MANFTPLASTAGGVLIGLAAVWLLAANGRIAGVSGILHGFVTEIRSADERSWRLAFIAGLVAAGFAWHWYAGPVPAREGFLGWAAVAGVLVGLGTRLSGGCTSGHGICGLGRLSLRSLVAVSVFMACGVVAAIVMRHALGVAS